MEKPIIYDWAKGFQIYHGARRQIQFLISNPTTTINGVENESQQGAALIANGAAVLNRLVSLEAIAHEDIESPVSIPTASAFEKYILEKGKEDGCHVIDSAANQINRVGEIYMNKCPEFKDVKFFTSRVPYDFITDGGLEEVKLKQLGTKTRLVMRAPYMLDGVNGFQIKRTQYGPLGLGKVTWFDKLGLYKEFYMTTEQPISALSSRGAEILGVEKQYIDRPNSWRYKQTVTRIPVRDLLAGVYHHDFKQHKLAA